MRIYMASKTNESEKKQKTKQKEHTKI